MDTLQTRFEEVPTRMDSTASLQAWAAERVGTPYAQQAGTAFTLEWIKEVLAERGEPLIAPKADS